MARTAVGVIRCEGYADAARVRAAVAAAFDLFGGAGAVIRRGQKVLLKPNLLSVCDPESGINTHPSVVRAVAGVALDAGAEVVIGDSPAFSRLEDVGEACGVAQVARELGIALVPFRQPVRVPARCPGGPSAGYKIERAVLDADVLINLPKLKSHRQLGFTGAAKNLYGCMPGKRKAWYHARMHGDATFAAYQAGFAATVAPAFSLVDAVVAMHRTGPKGGDLLPMGLLFAGRDPFAVDTLISRVIRIPEPDNLIVNAARRLGLGTTDPSAIETLGLDPFSLPPFEFRHPLLVGTSFSFSRLARSTWRSFLSSHLGVREKV